MHWDTLSVPLVATIHSSNLISILALSRGLREPKGFCNIAMVVEFTNDKVRFQQRRSSNNLSHRIDCVRILRVS
jgi:hypothetical protein